MTYVSEVEYYQHSIAGSWTRVSRVRAEYPNQLDYNGSRWTHALLFQFDSNK